ncbi:MAG: SGNH/GDSL hydrolase family protein [Firmicutes bacterium]|nr:SGNH/GDSL hydrolase family protein [Bacillota bacterium]
MLVLFQGDSVTDWGRDYDNAESLGYGYPFLTANWFSALHPEKNVRFVNRGVSGNRVRDLEKRWKADCLDLKPHVVSIMIGINDCWRRYDQNDPTSVESFEAGYTNILAQTREHLDAEIVLIEPFLLPVLPGQEEWREDLDPKIQVVRKLAREFETALIPMDGLFGQAMTKREPSYWAADGVHPTDPGHALIAQAWLKTVSWLKGR